MNTIKLLLLVFSLLFSLAHAFAQVAGGGAAGFPSHPEVSTGDKPVTGIKCPAPGEFWSSAVSSGTFIVKISVHDGAGDGGTVGGAFLGYLEGVFMDGKKESLWKKYGTGPAPLREDTYKDGLLHGDCRVFSEDGELLYREIFVNGTGNYKEYYHEYNDDWHLLLEGRLQSGKREGEWKYYFESGSLSHMETYKDGVLHGPYKVFNQEGKLLYSTEFKEGTGLYKSFDTNPVRPSEKDRLLEEGRMEKSLRVGEWTKRDNGVVRQVTYTPDSPENTSMRHNLIQTVYFNGKAYNVHASGL